MAQYLEEFVFKSIQVLCLFSSRLFLFQELQAFVFKLLPLCHIMSDFCESTQPAVLMPQRGNIAVGPEATAILSHTPSFGMPPSLYRCLCESVHRSAGFPILF